MNKNDAAIIKVLADLGLYKEYELSDNQEYQVQRALDSDAIFLDDIEKLFQKSSDTSN